MQKKPTFDIHYNMDFEKAVPVRHSSHLLYANLLVLLLYLRILCRYVGGEASSHQLVL
jgi:hypothetical protein